MIGLYTKPIGLTGVVVELYTCILEVLGSSSGRDTG
jgi:hypothetical protein